MKQSIFFTFLLCCCFTVSSQVKSTYVCRYGFTFEISMQKNWGYSQPVVLSVTPNTSADACGLKPDDIIETVDGKPTAGEMIDTVISWLQNSPSIPIRLTVSNLKESHRERTLTNYCRLNNSLMERDLASIYSFYSLEDVQSRAFTCPFKTSANPESNLMLYSSFGFTPSDPNNQQLDKTINAAVRKNLEQKGLNYSEKNPDLMVHTYYSYTKNPNFRKSMNVDKFPVVCRYDRNLKSMKELPIYYNPLIHKDQAQFFLQFGIRLIDAKNNNRVVWECEADELLQSDYSLADYAEFHVPLMLMQYPYPKSTETASFYYSRTKYNYTGINYNIDNLKKVTEVDASSPAAKAGIQPEDVVEKINGIQFVNNPKSADSKYKQFIFKTMSFRNPDTQFTNAEGFSRCMYWDKMNYAQVQDEFRKPEFSTVFSYLFYFTPYINLSGTNIVSFTIVRGKQKEEIKIKPVILSEEVFENR